MQEHEVNPTLLSLMWRAIESGRAVKRTASPNPGVGAWLVAKRHTSGEWEMFGGATEPPGGRHAEIVAIDSARAAGATTVGATLATTLEPCSHHGRTGPCAEAIIAAGITHVLIGLTDPDPKVAGRGIARLQQAGVTVTVGVLAGEIEHELEEYLHHRRTGRPFVTLKLAATLDGRTAAPDQTSQWITSEESRRDAHLLRATHDAILVGAGTVRADDPTLTVRLVDGIDPIRIVLGKAPATANVHPCLEMSGSPLDVLTQLGDRDILSVLIEGGATVAHDFQSANLVNRYVMYLAPALMGGDDGLAMFRGAGSSTISEVWRGRIVSSELLGTDLRIELRPT
jgi:diaminohydroxyphosphoribosylaminopyrimidine deaminase / 5-amino-6-(5-phosphoribosylamino)uracil reductase